MCVAVFAWLCQPSYRLILALNRDELHSRPTLPAHWWIENQNILGGRDGLEGGTWLACSKQGRLAFLTNFREPEDRKKTNPISRGHLVGGFLQSSKSPMEYIQQVSAEMEKYNGFNLVVVDLCTGKMAYVSNRPQANPAAAQEILPGIHVLSNGSLDSPWPKAIRGRRKLETLLAEVRECEIPEERIVEELLKDDTKAEKSALPNTGYSLDWEYKLSSIFVDFGEEKLRYGTRSMAVIAVHESGKVQFYERYLEGPVWKEHQICFQILEECSTNLTAN